MRRATSVPPVRGARGGTTLVEVVVALVILVGALLGMASFGLRFAQGVTDTRLRSTALDLATDRLEEVKVAPSYAAVSTYAGVEMAPNGMRGYTRRTVVVRIGGLPSDSVDYRTVTVEVSATGMRTPVRKSTIIANY